MKHDWDDRDHPHNCTSSIQGFMQDFHLERGGGGHTRHMWVELFILGILSFTVDFGHSYIGNSGGGGGGSQPLPL